MTYQAFSNCNPLNINDAGFVREFKFIIPEDKYITQNDIHFNIEYSKANQKQTPLFMFRDIELFINDNLLAHRMFCSLEEMIIDGCLYIDQVFPGIKFKYASNDSLTFKFTRSAIKNKCLKFECHYNCHVIPEEGMLFGLFTGYKEYVLPAGFISNNINIEPDVKSFKMVPCVSYSLYKNLKIEDYKSEVERLIKEYYNKMKLKYYKNGLEISEKEFGKTPGMYHIDLLNEEELSKNEDFYKIDYKIICKC